MTLTDQIKILNDEIKANQAQYILDREVANISALLSDELKNYKFLSREDMGYEPGVVEKAKFEYYFDKIILRLSHLFQIS